MRNQQLLLYEEDHRKVQAVIQQLIRDADALAIFVVDMNGQLVAETGELQDIDTTSIASLCAGCVAATAGLARLVGENDFPVHFHQGRRASLHITRIASQMILAVVFDDRSSLGLVRLRVRKAATRLGLVVEEMHKRAERPRAFGTSPFADITDEDIDNLFSN